MLKKLTVEDVDLKGKKVIARVDFNVPLDASGAITDDLRIRAALPTVEYMLEKGAAVILMSHLGRPKGAPEAKYSLKPVYDYLVKSIKAPVTFASDSVGDDATAKAAALKPGEVLLLENLRFNAGEQKNDEEFAKKLASMADLYVNDAFGVDHRPDASVSGITKFLPVSVAGFLLKKEIEYFENTLENPERPFVAILGGAKVSDKILVIERLLDIVDAVLVGGGMSFTFIKAMGGAIGSSKCEDDRLESAAALIKLAADKGVGLLLPTDIIAADSFSNEAQKKTVAADKIPDGWMGLDIGPESITQFLKQVESCKTVLWNGPMGVFEFEAFSTGTREIAMGIARTECVSIVGGGDSAAAVNQMGLADKFTHISTGGGASLEMLEGKKLPGLEALTDR